MHPLGLMPYWKKKPRKVFRSHHEKLVIVDYQICFIGGLDLCFGRYDSFEHQVGDYPPTVWPGKDYYNPRYETSAHLWLVLEYCVGGDLMSLLQQLCDFGLSRKLSDISKTPSLLPQAKRGTPFYMAPELFQDGGIHSYASDLWALGCVLYECYAGNPPFIGKEFTRLVKSILSDPTPSLPRTPSRPFVNLVEKAVLRAIIFPCLSILFI